MDEDDRPERDEDLINTMDNTTNSMPNESFKI